MTLNCAQRQPSSVCRYVHIKCIHTIWHDPRCDATNTHTHIHSRTLHSLYVCALHFWYFHLGFDFMPITSKQPQQQRWQKWRWIKVMYAENKTVCAVCIKRQTRSRIVINFSCVFLWTDWKIRVYVKQRAAAKVWRRRENKRRYQRNKKKKKKTYSSRRNALHHAEWNVK